MSLQQWKNEFPYLKGDEHRIKICAHIFFLSLPGISLWLRKSYLSIMSFNHFWPWKSSRKTSGVEEPPRLNDPQMQSSRGHTSSTLLVLKATPAWGTSSDLHWGALSEKDFLHSCNTGISSRTSSASCPFPEPTSDIILLHSPPESTAGSCSGRLTRHPRDTLTRWSWSSCILVT